MPKDNKNQSQNLSQGQPLTIGQFNEQMKLRYPLPTNLKDCYKMYESLRMGFVLLSMDLGYMPGYDIEEEFFEEVGNQIEKIIKEERKRKRTV